MLSVLFFLGGCRPTYPKEKISEAVVDLCKKEYNLNVEVSITGGTIAVYVPVDKLFDALLNIDDTASKKINDVIFAVTRVTLSTDAKFDFYVMIAQDPAVPEIEIIYIRYVNDVKHYLLGDISRDDYSKRAVIAIKTPPQAERERILKEVLSKLNVKDADDLVKEYLNAGGGISGIGEISYWDKKFFIKDIELTEFLAGQIAERIRAGFKEDKDINRLYETKNAGGKFIGGFNGKYFSFSVDIADRVAPLYLSSGMEFGSQKKRAIVFGKLFGIVSDTLYAYGFKDFDGVEFSAMSEKTIISREKLREFKHKKLKIEDLI